MVGGYLGNEERVQFQTAHQRRTMERVKQETVLIRISFAKANFKCEMC